MRALALLGAAVLVLSTAAPVQSSTAVDLRWEMNEGLGSTQMRDASGHAVHGSIGSDIGVGTLVSGATAYRFPAVAPDAPPVRPGHTVVVGHDARLNPQGRRYGVELRLRTRATGGNIVQKGQSGTAGGFWKLELNDGQATCLFRDGTGVTSAVRYRAKAVNDGNWHTVRCERSDKGTQLWVDGVLVTNSKRTGHIANTHPLSVGGKQKCNQRNVGCDYYGGYLDYLRISRS